MYISISVFKYAFFLYCCLVERLSIFVNGIRPVWSGKTRFPCTPLPIYRELRLIIFQKMLYIVINMLLANILALESIRNSITDVFVTKLQQANKTLCLEVLNCACIFHLKQTEFVIFYFLLFNNNNHGGTFTNRLCSFQTCNFTKGKDSTTIKKVHFLLIYAVVWSQIHNVFTHVICLQ